VARLFALVRPQKAYFGLKDYQQYLVIKRMTQDLGLPVALVGCPIVRESDGLAMSSRNRRLDPVSREKALALSRALDVVADLAKEGERSPVRLRAEGLRVLTQAPGLTVEYFELADPDTLLPIRRLEKTAMALCACTLSGTRLIDNRPIKGPKHA